MDWLMNLLRAAAKVLHDSEKSTAQAGHIGCPMQLVTSTIPKKTDR